MSEKPTMAQARKHVAALKCFYVHFFIFVLVMAILAAVNILFTAKVWWVQWPLLGWGAGIVAHAVALFGRAPKAIAKWEEKKIREMMK